MVTRTKKHLAKRSKISSFQRIGVSRKEASSKVKWQDKHQIALDRLKYALLQNCQPLHSVDFTKRFILSVDASQHAVGCCLMQEHIPVDGLTPEECRDKKLYPIAFASTKLTDTQSRWSTIEREAYAVIWALKKYRHWLLLSEVVVYSDHNPLSYLTLSAPKSAKLTRWSLALQEFNLTFQYKPGKEQVVPDFLSRLSVICRPNVNSEDIRKACVAKVCRCTVYC